jgi:hypothetical protein
MSLAEIRRNPFMLRGMLHCGKNRGALASDDRDATKAAFRATFPPEMLAS